MKYERLHVLVEGRDDREFFNAVIRPICAQQYDHVQIWEYAGEMIERRIKYINSICAMNADYLFVADINSSPCVTEKKTRVANSHKEMIEAERIVVVVKEIESWYLAGVDNQICQELGIASLAQTDHVTKEIFREMIPRRFKGSAVDFMTVILKGFSTKLAQSRNRSFGYLMDLLETRSKEA